MLMIITLCSLLFCAIDSNIIISYTLPDFCPARSIVVDVRKALDVHCVCARFFIVIVNMFFALYCIAFSFLSRSSCWWIDDERRSFDLIHTIGELQTY